MTHSRKFWVKPWSEEISQKGRTRLFAGARRVFLLFAVLLTTSFAGEDFVVKCPAVEKYPVPYYVRPEAYQYEYQKLLALTPSKPNYVQFTCVQYFKVAYQWRRWLKANEDKLGSQRLNFVIDYTLDQAGQMTGLTTSTPEVTSTYGYQIAVASIKEAHKNPQPLIPELIQEMGNPLTLHARFDIEGVAPLTEANHQMENCAAYFQYAKDREMSVSDLNLGFSIQLERFPDKPNLAFYSTLLRWNIYHAWRRIVREKHADGLGKYPRLHLAFRCSNQGTLLDYSFQEKDMAETEAAQMVKFALLEVFQNPKPFCKEIQAETGGEFSDVLLFEY